MEVLPSDVQTIVYKYIHRSIVIDMKWWMRKHVHMHNLCVHDDDRIPYYPGSVYRAKTWYQFVFNWRKSMKRLEKTNVDNKELIEHVYGTPPPPPPLLIDNE